MYVILGVSGVGAYDGYGVIFDAGVMAELVVLSMGNGRFHSSHMLALS